LDKSIRENTDLCGLTNLGDFEKTDRDDLTGVNEEKNIDTEKTDKQGDWLMRVKAKTQNKGRADNELCRIRVRLKVQINQPVVTQNGGNCLKTYNGVFTRTR
jgi:hypothetical protein